MTATRRRIACLLFLVAMPYGCGETTHEHPGGTGGVAGAEPGTEEGAGEGGASASSSPVVNGGASAGGADGVPSGAGGVPEEQGGAAGAAGAPPCPTELDALQTDPNHCGACGYACVHGRQCVSGRCLPAWQPLETDGAPSPRTRHAAGFVDGKLVVFGGAPTATGVALATAAAYDVTTDTWSELAAMTNARCAHEAVSTGKDILTFGGLTNCGDGTTTGPALERFVPNEAAGGWSKITTGGPAPRYDFASVWTGGGMFVYGGSDGLAPAVSTGGYFLPYVPVWLATDCGAQGCERGGTFSIFMGSGRAYVWGGGPYGSAPTGLYYDLTEYEWQPWLVPEGTAEHLAKRFVDDGKRLYYLTDSNVVSIFEKQAATWLPNDTSQMPSGFCTEAAAAWTGSELVAWSGDCGNGAVNVGGRYQPPRPD